MMFNVQDSSLQCSSKSYIFHFNLLEELLNYNYCTQNHVNPNYYFLPPLHKFNVVMSANLAQKQRSLRKKHIKWRAHLPSLSVNC
jgi:hypothetical protein